MSNTVIDGFGKPSIRDRLLILRAGYTGGLGLFANVDIEKKAAIRSKPRRTWGEADCRIVVQSTESTKQRGPVPLISRKYNHHPTVAGSLFGSRRNNTHGLTGLLVGKGGPVWFKSGVLCFSFGIVEHLPKELLLMGGTDLARLVGPKAKI